MPLIVQKYGGTSVANPERIKNVARRCVETARAGHRVAVVVSAMAGETDRLIGLARSVSAEPSDREYDQIVSTGETVSIGLVCMAIHAMGHAATSFTGAQAGLRTDNVFAKARIQRLDGERIRACLDDGHIAVVAGFQGVDEAGNVTTLGRGGSDTSAVALAIALGADLCEIYTDVDGVYTTDPNICPSARKLDRIAFEEMLELASLGAKVLQIRSVELASKYRMPVHVRSSFVDTPGTLVTREEKMLEGVVVTGVAVNRNEAKVLLRRVPDRPGVAARLFAALAEAAINVDVIIQNMSADGFTDLTFTVDRTDLARARRIVEQIGAELDAGPVETDDNIAKVSIVGLGMRSHAGVAARMFRLLADEGINIQLISTSEIKVSCVIHSKYAELAVRTLHDGFALDEPPVEEAGPAA
jgi:aspartate kinase